jgi:phosphate transport system substrate-binding protein
MKRMIMMLAVVVAAQVTGAATLKIAGSDTLVRLGQRLAAEYMRLHKGVSIKVSGGGSATGFEALIKGEADICEASRDMGPLEYAYAEERGVRPFRVPVARDGVVVYVHPENTLEGLSIDQLKAVFTGRVVNFAEVGGPDLKIRAYGRDSNSGTYFFFRQNALDYAPYSSSLVELPSTASVVNAVARDRHGIGYGGIAWSKEARLLAVSISEDAPAVLPTPETVASGEYPLSRYLYWYTDGEPTGEVKRLINWVLGEQGRRVTQEAGYVPLTERQAEANMVR